MVDAVEDVARDNAASLGSVECSTHYEDLLEDPEVEAVVVASPTPLHGLGLRSASWWGGSR